MGDNFLTDGLHEFHMLKHLLNQAIYDEFQLDMRTAPVLLLLAVITSRKLDYYQRKYEFSIAEEDYFYIEDLERVISFKPKEEEPPKKSAWEVEQELGHKLKQAQGKIRDLQRKADHYDALAEGGKIVKEDTYQYKVDMDTAERFREIAQDMEVKAGEHEAKAEERSKEEATAEEVSSDE